MTHQPTPERLQAFLEDLRLLYEKHGLVISACGCCDSPWVEDSEGNLNLIERELQHLGWKGSMSNG